MAIPSEAELRRCEFQTFRVNEFTIWSGHDLFYFSKDGGRLRGTVDTYKELIVAVAHGKTGTPQPSYLRPLWPASKPRLMK